MAHCLRGRSLLLTGLPGAGKTHLARRIVSQLREAGDLVQLALRRGSLGAAHGAQRAVQAGLAGDRGSDAARRRLVGRHRLRLHGPKRAVPAHGRLQAASCRAGQLRGVAGGAAAEGLGPALGFGLGGTATSFWNERIFRFISWARPRAVRVARREFPRP